VSGGHDAFDPLTALACCAAATERIKLLPYTLILPYRNPLLLAKSIATLDVVSSGRAIVGAGTGYLRSEGEALGIDFAERTRCSTKQSTRWSQRGLATTWSSSGVASPRRDTRLGPVRCSGLIHPSGSAATVVSPEPERRESEACGYPC
jgi:hypothetical protein